MSTAHLSWNVWWGGKKTKTDAVFKLQVHPNESRNTTRLIFKEINTSYLRHTWAPCVNRTSLAALTSSCVRRKDIRCQITEHNMAVNRIRATHSRSATCCQAPPPSDNHTCVYERTIVRVQVTLLHILNTSENTTATHKQFNDNIENRRSNWNVNAVTKKEKKWH